MLKRIGAHSLLLGVSRSRRMWLLVASILLVIIGWFGVMRLLGSATHPSQTGQKAVRGDERPGEKPNGVGGEANSPVEANIVCGTDKAEMIFISPGEFTMGTDGGYANEKPEHTVALDGFYIYNYEVTVGQYKRFLQDPQGRGHQPDEPYGEYMPADYFTNPKYDDYPVVNVNWDDAEAYCRWAGNRLPREAEWEKAARGTDRRVYPWGDAWDEKRTNGDDESSRFRGDGFRFTAPVGSFPTGVSPFGLHDMAGNVWEWVDEWYQPYAGNPSQDVDYGKTYRVVRGGSWLRYPLGLTATARDTCAPGLRFDSIGFRCACNRR